MAIAKVLTSTYTRLELIKTQFRITLRRTTIIDPNTLRSIEKGLDNKWIEKLAIYGFDYNNYCRAQLVLKIDWNEYNTQIAKGNVEIAIDTNQWTNQTAIEIDELIILFNKYVEQCSLSTRFVVWYPNHLNGDYINQQLGFISADPIKWAPEKKKSFLERFFSIKEVSELKVGLRMLG